MPWASNPPMPTNERPALRPGAVGAIAGVLLLGLMSTARAETVTVTIRDYRFQPAEVTVHAGDTVRWVNDEKRQYHNVWFEQNGEPEPPYLFPEETFERAFPEPGTFPYRCGPHPEMTGVVRVTE